MKKQIYVCRRLRLLNHLKSKGFLPYQTQPDINNPRFNVWLYEETPELRNAIEDYYNGEGFLNRDR